MTSSFVSLFGPSPSGAGAKGTVPLQCACSVLDVFLHIVVTISGDAPDLRLGDDSLHETSSNADRRTSKVCFITSPAGAALKVGGGG